MSDEWLSKIFDKVEKMEERIDNIDKTLIEQHVTLQEHMRRSLANEEAVELLSSRIQPIEQHVYRIEGILKFFGGISVLVATTAGLIKILRLFFQ